MRCAHARLGKLSLLVGVVAWFLGMLAVQVHALRTLHFECDEHGEIVSVDLGGAPAHAHPGADTARAAEVERDLDHGCALLGVALFATPAVHLAFSAKDTVVQVVQRPPATVAPRGSPLAWAPKTSPPVWA